ncbi:transketolase family protein [Nanoarchaeota archaeon]
MNESTREGFGRALVKLGKNKEVLALSADLSESTKLSNFIKKFPKQYIEMGVAEQNMAGVSAGLALCGKIPFISSYAVFSPGRNWEQIRVSVCYSKANVKIAGCHAGLLTGPDGATHQALEDIAITRCLPNMTVIVPADSIEAEKATIAAASIKGPVYLRFGREKVPVITTKRSLFKVGKAEVLKEGKDVCVIACGVMVYEALIAAKELEKQGISVMVINNHTIKPFDEKTIISAAKKCKAIVTAEEHQITGGLGSAVAEVLSKSQPTPMKFVGVKDTFGESGNPEELMRKYECDSKSIIKAVKEVLRKK